MRKSEIEKIIKTANTALGENKLLRKTLTEIACMGDGIKADVIDWANIGKNAKYKANEVLKPKCPTCGK